MCIFPLTHAPTWQMWDRTSSPAFMTSEPAILPATCGEGQECAFSPHSCPHMTDVGQDQLFHSHALWDSWSPPLPFPNGSALLCCPGKAQRLLSRMLQAVRGSTLCSPILITFGENRSHGHQPRHGPWQPRPRHHHGPRW